MKVTLDINHVYLLSTTSMNTNNEGEHCRWIGTPYVCIMRCRKTAKEKEKKKGWDRKSKKIVCKGTSHSFVFLTSLTKCYGVFISVSSCVGHLIHQALLSPFEIKLIRKVCCKTKQKSSVTMLRFILNLEISSLHVSLQYIYLQ